MKNKAFTLIELLVVVLIIGILAAIAVPKYQFAVAKSKFSILKDATTALKNAQEIYYLQNGTYANRFDLLDINLPGEWEQGTTTETKDNRIYSWGKCQLTNNSCYCSNGDNAYQMYYQNATSSNKGHIKCIAWMKENQTKQEAQNSIPGQVCKQETNTINCMPSYGYCLSTYNTK